MTSYSPRPSLASQIALGVFMTLVSSLVQGCAGHSASPNTAGPGPKATQEEQADADDHGHGHGHHGHGHHGHGEGHGEGHGHGGGHDPLVHRFEHADQWVAEFDNPSRDAWQHPADVIGAMAIKPGMTVVDLGAGTGYFEPWLSKAVGDTGTVLALDIEPDMVRYLNERVAREKLSNVRPAVVPMGEPKFPISPVDRVLIVDTWHHIPERAAYVAKLRDGVREGGQVYVVDFTLEAKHGPPAKHRLSADQVVQELKAGGFSAQISPTQLPEQYIVVGTR